MTKDDGGYAFPESHFDLAEGEHGMTLRDYFAAKAPIHDLKFESANAAAKFVGADVPTTDDDLVVVLMSCAAKTSYAYADAMLKERQK